MEGGTNLMIYLLFKSVSKQSKQNIRMNKLDELSSLFSSVTFFGKFSGTNH